MHFQRAALPNSLIPCGHNAHRECSVQEWEQLVQRVADPGVARAFTFHWVPKRVGGFDAEEPLWPTAMPGSGKQPPPGPTLSQKFAVGKPDYIIMNNCLHTYPYSFNLPEPLWQQHLGDFLGMVSWNIKSLKAAGFTGGFQFQTCTKLDCNATQYAYIAQSGGEAICRRKNKELSAVKTAQIQMITELGLSVMDAFSITGQYPDKTSDGLHPCFIRPCSWTPQTVARDRQQDVASAQYTRLRGKLQADETAYQTGLQFYQQQARLGPSSDLAIEAQFLGQEFALVQSEAQQVSMLFQQVPHSPYARNNEGLCMPFFDSWSAQLQDAAMTKKFSSSLLDMGAPLPVIRVAAPVES
mmetsp:Transcript_46857/g.123902  ORF Transcript_46857/g.123902 Transcript_46857/m.123902 type:complete len:354 (+) Transcript_46857:287-1348(+)